MSLIRFGFPDLEPFDSGPVVDKLHLEQHICVLEESMFETYNEELGALEVLADHDTNVLRVRQVES